MPKRIVVPAEGQFYHLYNRGALRNTMFYSPAMYGLFLSMMQIWAARCNISIIAVCLMPNHFHLLIRVGSEGRVDEFMRQLCGGYSRRVNMTLKRSGTIFEGRYHVKHVTTDEYFRRLCSYIHLNPVRAALVEHPAQWEYSNLQECLSLRHSILCDHKMITDVFGSAGRYESYLMEEMYSTKIGDLKMARDLAEMHAV